jgi:hypothetical protein
MISKSPDANLIRAYQLSTNWAQYRENARFEDPMIYEYAKFLADTKGLGHIELERHMHHKETLSDLHQLVVAAPDFYSMVTEAPKISDLKPSAVRTPNGILQHQRSLMKAMILAEMSREYIAMQLNTTIDVVAIFEFLCWNIRNKMSSRAWLCSYLFPGGISAEVSAYDTERLMLLAAYKHGADALMDNVNLTGPIMDPKAYATRISNRNACDAQRRTADIIHTAPMTRHNTTEFITMAIGIEKAEKELRIRENLAGTGETESALLARIFQAMQGLQLKPQDPTVPWHSGAEERLNDDDLKLAYAATEPPKGTP